MTCGPVSPNISRLRRELTGSSKKMAMLATSEDDRTRLSVEHKSEASIGHDAGDVTQCVTLL